MCVRGHVLPLHDSAHASDIGDSLRTKYTISPSVSSQFCFTVHLSLNVVIFILIIIFCNELCSDVLLNATCKQSHRFLCGGLKMHNYVMSQNSDQQVCVYCIYIYIYIYNIEFYIFVKNLSENILSLPVVPILNSVH